MTESRSSATPTDGALATPRHAHDAPDEERHRKRLHRDRNRYRTTSDHNAHEETGRRSQLQKGGLAWRRAGDPTDRHTEEVHECKQRAASDEPFGSSIP